MKLTIIIVSFNTKIITLECLRSVFREAINRSFEVIVFDNASSDGSADAVEAEFGANALVIRSSTNIGFAAGNNAAAKFASGDWLLLLNPDTEIKEHAIDRLLDFAVAYPRAGIWGGRTVFKNGQLNPTFCWGRQTVWSLLCQAFGLSAVFRTSPFFNPEGVGAWCGVIDREVDIVSGCFLLTRKSIWQQLSGFDSRFFMYGEEADFCLRARAMGARPMICAAIEIVHYGGASESIREDKIVRLLAAKEKLIRLHFPKSSKHIGLGLLGLWPLTRWLVHAIFAALGRHASQQHAAVWRGVVLRRGEWSGRY